MYIQASGSNIRIRKDIRKYFPDKKKKLRDIRIHSYSLHCLDSRLIIFNTISGYKFLSIWINFYLTSEYSSFPLQVNRPLSMKKDGIQTRNRKVSSKTKKGKKHNDVKQEEGKSDTSISISSGHYLSSQESMFSFPGSSVISSQMLHPSTAFSKPAIHPLHPGLFAPIVPQHPSSLSSVG